MDNAQIDTRIRADNLINRNAMFCGNRAQVITLFDRIDDILSTFFRVKKSRIGRWHGLLGRACEGNLGAPP